MQEQEKLSDVAALLELRRRQTEIINSVKTPSCEKFWLAEGKAGIWFIPACALAGHFWFLCFLDWYYGLGWKVVLYLADSDILGLTISFTVAWIVFVPLIMAASFDIASINHDWPKQKLEYIKRLKEANDKANSLCGASGGSEYTSVCEYKAALRRHLRLGTGSAIPPAEEVLKPRPVNNPHIITLEMLGVEQEELRGASCLMPKI